MRSRTPRAGTVRKALLVLAFVAVFLTVGLPRWLGSAGPSVGSNDNAKFTKVCREHGGTPKSAPALTGAPPQPICTVRYGGRDYRMDAITPAGFDVDTARFQRQGCDEARAEQTDLTVPGQHRARFIYHALTGVCERRP